MLIFMEVFLMVRLELNRAAVLVSTTGASNYHQQDEEHEDNPYIIQAAKETAAST
ncbi:hypothetical protein JQN58_39020 [Aneurinibacillus sp. BA2021]|nr:hypothetical protein [Aneurinibacillus sp. BA2021]